jgi:excisionase family DNA binding protein
MRTTSPGSPDPDHDQRAPEALLTVADVARMLQVSNKWVYARARSGELRSGYVGKYLRFRYGDVLSFIDTLFANRPSGAP